MPYIDQIQLSSTTYDIRDSTVREDLINNYVPISGTTLTGPLIFPSTDEDAYSFENNSGYKVSKYGNFIAKNGSYWSLSDSTGTSKFKYYWNTGNITEATWEGQPIEISYGGTGATTATLARQNLNAASLGSNTFTNTQQIQSSTISVTSSNNITATYRQFQFVDNYNRSYATFAGSQKSNGTVYAALLSRRYKNSTTTETVNQLTLLTSVNGDASVEVTHPEEWRKAIFDNNNGVLSIANGGTGATSKTTAIHELFNSNVGTNTTHFLTIKNDWSKGGYCSIADAKTVLGLGSLAYKSSLVASDIPELNASKITAGTIDADRILSYTTVAGDTSAGGNISLGFTDAYGTPVAARVGKSDSDTGTYFAAFGNRRANNTGSWYAKIFNASNNAVLANTAVSLLVWYLKK